MAKTKKRTLYKWNISLELERESGIFISRKYKICTNKGYMTSNALFPHKATGHWLAHAINPNGHN